MLRTPIIIHPIIKVNRLFSQIEIQSSPIPIMYVMATNIREFKKIEKIILNHMTLFCF